jgi:hypothetical protein
VRNILVPIAVLLATTALTTGAATAQGRSGLGRGYVPAFGQAGQFGWGSSGYPPGFSQGRKRGWRSANTPPGWSHGRRRGWQGGTVPPGWSHTR